jgi:hypothetical protein
VTTVTNLTNAPTNGDLTATMKASVTTAATAATPTAAGVTGDTKQTGDAYAALTAATTELAAAPTITASILDKIKWVFQLSKNKRLATATKITLRNDADGADVATADVSDDGTTFEQKKWS